MISQLDGLLLVDKPQVALPTTSSTLFAAASINEKSDTAELSTPSQLAFLCSWSVVPHAFKTFLWPKTKCTKALSNSVKQPTLKTRQEKFSKLSLFPLSTQPQFKLRLKSLQVSLIKFPHGLGDQKDGVPLYKLAREGKTIDRPPRRVRIDKYEILEVALPIVRFRIHCTKGFYVRTYCHDLGAILGPGGHMSALTEPDQEISISPKPSAGPISKRPRA